MTLTPFLERFQLLMIPMVMSVLYVWAQFNKDTIVSFWFGTRFKVFTSNGAFLFFRSDNGLIKTPSDVNLKWTVVFAVALF